MKSANNFYVFRNRAISMGIGFVLLLLILAGCTRTTLVTPLVPLTMDTVLPPATATLAVTETPAMSTVPYQPIVVKGGNAQFYMRLPDGSEVILDPDSEIEITKFMGFAMDTMNYEIVIHRGGMLIISHLPKEQWFIIKSPQGYIARVRGSIIHVKLDIEDGKFEAACVEGECELGPDDKALIQLAVKEQGLLDTNGNFQGIVEVDLDELRNTYGTAIPTESPTEISMTDTPEATFTPNIAATATAACKTFQENFPSTPCP